MSNDTIFLDANTGGKPFVFNEQVVAVFPDMIRRSVPGYTQTLSAIGRLAARYVREDSNVYDLGCSLGAATLAVRHAIGERRAQLIGIDTSAALLKTCQELLDADHATAPVELREEDIAVSCLENASMVILNFTLQFVPPDQRDSILKRIHAGLNPGGVLVLSEKIRFDEDRISSAIIALHEDFKRENAYTELEISRKRDSLENVLIPDTLAGLSERLSRAGFADQGVWQQYYNFASLLAFK